MNYKILQYYSKKILSIVLALSIIISFGGCSFFNRNNSSDNEKKNNVESLQTPDNPEFTEYINNYFCDILDDNLYNTHSYLQHPKDYGIHSYESLLGRYDIDNYSDTSEITDTIATLKTFDYDSLSEKQKLTYQAIMKDCELTLEYSDLALYDSCLQILTGMQINLPVLFSEYVIIEKKDIDDYLKLLEDVDGYFNNIIEFEKLRAKNGLFMEDELVDEIISGCNSFIETLDKDSGIFISSFTERINSLSFLTEQEKSDYLSRNKDIINKHVIPGYKALVEGLTSLKGTNQYKGGACNYPEGKRFFEYKLKSYTGWSKSVEELEKLVDSYLSANMLKIQGIAMVNPTILDEISNYRFHETEPEKIIEDLKKKITWDFPEIPEVDYTISYISKSLEEYLSPAMYFIPQLDNSNINSIYINNGSHQTDENTLYVTLAHESYPGHLYQTHFFRNTKPDLLRYIISPIGYIEGWGSYVENMSYKYNEAASESANSIMSANHIATLCLYAKCDIGVNYNGWTLDDVFKFIQKYGIGDKSVAKEMYNMFISDPGYYCKYVIGMLAFEELRNKASMELGDSFVLKDFHQFILELGPIQFDIVFEKLDEWIKSQT